MLPSLSPLRGAVRPRVEVHPPAVDTLGDEAGQLALAAGLVLEPWQLDGLRIMLSVREDGKWACFEYGEICARQNGKSALFLVRALAGMLLLDEQVVLWSAHEVKTSMRAWRDLRRLLRNLGTQVNENLIDVDGIPVKVNASNGQEGFERLDTGQEIKVVARSKGSGRGFSTDCMIVDEAFAYEEVHQDALLPTLTARPNPQICYASSPPLKGATAAPMYAMRARAASGGDETLGWRDWGLDSNLEDLLALPVPERVAFLDNREAWAATNPALGLGRVREESILRLRRSLSEAGFAREILGCWPRRAEAGENVIPSDVWLTLADPSSQIQGPLVFAVDATPERSGAAIAVAGRRADGVGHVEVVDARPGTGWVVDRIVELNRSHRPRAWVLDPASSAGAWIPAMQERGIEPVLVTGREMAQACGALYEDVVENAALRHLDQPNLNAALVGARKRPLSDAWGWHRRNSDVDISPLVAVTLAWQGLATHGSPAKRSAYESDDAELMIV